MSTIRPYSQTGKDLIPGVGRRTSRFKDLQRKYLLQDQKSSKLFTPAASELKRKLEEALGYAAMTTVFAAVMIVPDVAPRAPPEPPAAVQEYGSDRPYDPPPGQFDADEESPPSPTRRTRKP